MDNTTLHFEDIYPSNEVKNEKYTNKLLNQTVSVSVNKRSNCNNIYKHIFYCCCGFLYS